MNILYAAVVEVLLLILLSFVIIVITIINVFFADAEIAIVPKN